MKTILKTMAVTAPAVLLAVTLGCSSPTDTQTGSFEVTTEYGAPGALTPDPNVYIFGNAIAPYVCTEGTAGCVYPTNLVLSAYTGTAGSYVMSTNAVGGQIWDVAGNPSSNCPSGYPTVTPTVPGEGQVPLVCADQTAYFASSPAEITDPPPYTPPPVTFTANHAVFPKAQFASATTLYNQEGTEQSASTVTSSSTSVITVQPVFAVPDDPPVQSVVILRNPSTNAVLGAGGIRVVPYRGGGR
jgi:hypothetical protein